MMKKINIDVGMCTGCGQCALTCAFKNAGAFDLSQSEISVVQWENICLSVPLVCQQCSDAPCIDSCPTDAIQFHSLTGAINIDMALCNQCHNCVEECRYQVIRVTSTDDVTTCDLCGGDPRCVKVCYPQALRFVEVDEVQNEPLREFAPLLVERLQGANVPPPLDLADYRIHPREDD